MVGAVVLDPGLLSSGAPTAISHLWPGCPCAGFNFTLPLFCTDAACVVTVLTVGCLLLKVLASAAGILMVLSVGCTGALTVVGKLVSGMLTVFCFPSGMMDVSV